MFICQRVYIIIYVYLNMILYVHTQNHRIYIYIWICLLSALENLQNLRQTDFANASLEPCFFWEVYKMELRGEATEAYADCTGKLRGAWFLEFRWGYLCGGYAKATEGEEPTTLFAYAGAAAVIMEIMRYSKLQHNLYIYIILFI